MHFETHDTLIDETQEVSSEAARTTDFHVQPNDLLELPMAQRMVIQYRPTAEARELCLYYGAREISFDDPDMFAFGETLGRQTRFVAQDAIQWGSGYAWTRVSPLLDELLSAGVLRRATGEQEAAFIGAASM